MNAITTDPRAALLAITAESNIRWAALLSESGFTPTETNAFASGGMLQAIFAATLIDAEKQARDVGDLLTKGGFVSVVVIEPSDDDPVWMVSGKSSRV